MGALGRLALGFIVALVLVGGPSVARAGGIDLPGTTTVTKPASDVAKSVTGQQSDSSPHADKSSTSRQAQQQSGSATPAPTNSDPFAAVTESVAAVTQETVANLPAPV